MGGGGIIALFILEREIELRQFSILIKLCSINVIVIMAVGSLNGCSSKEERLLRMQLQHELKIKKLETRNTQSVGEKIQDDLKELLLGKD